METHYYQSLLLIALYFLIFFNYAHSSPADILPNLQPVSSPGQQPGHPLTPESAPSLGSVSFPPSTSDPPSDSISPDTESFPSEVDLPSGSISPDIENSPSEVDPPSGSVSPDTKVDPPSESISPDTENFPSEVDSPSISDPPSDAFPPFNSDQPSESISPSTDVTPDVKKICESTDYPHLCLATVAPFLNGKTDVLSVLEVAMKVSKELAKIAFAMVKKFANAPGTPPKLVTILNDCKDSYDDALYNFENALNAFTARDIGTMNTMLSAVITDIGDCDDEFSQSDSPSPVSSYADKLTNMTSNCLAIVSLIN